MMASLGVKPEIEVIDTGHLWFAKQLAAEGLLDDPVLIQLCMGIPWGAPNDLTTFMAMVNNIPDHWHWSSFLCESRSNALCCRLCASRW